MHRPYTEALTKLRDAGLRPTRQRLALAKLLFERGDRHLTAEMLHNEALSAKVRVSLATVYNSLNQFTEAGLLREVVVSSGRSYFDTNTSNHHHFYYEDSGRLEDIVDDAAVATEIPNAPAGTKVSRVDVVVRLREL